VQNRNTFIIDLTDWQDMFLLVCIRQFFTLELAANMAKQANSR